MWVKKNNLVTKFNIKQFNEKPVQENPVFIRGKSIKQNKVNPSGKKVYINFKNIYKDALVSFQTNQKNWWH